MVWELLPFPATTASAMKTRARAIGVSLLGALHAMPCVALRCRAQRWRAPCQGPPSSLSLCVPSLFSSMPGSLLPLAREACFVAHYAGMVSRVFASWHGADTTRKLIADDVTAVCSSPSMVSRPPAFGHGQLSLLRVVWHRPQVGGAACSTHHFL